MNWERGGTEDGKRDGTSEAGSDSCLLGTWAGAGKRGAVTAVLLTHLAQRATSAQPAPGIALGRS